MHEAARQKRACQLGERLRVIFMHEQFAARDALELRATLKLRLHFARTRERKECVGLAPNEQRRRRDERVHQARNYLDR